jgi:hypothetical protein
VRYQHMPCLLRVECRVGRVAQQHAWGSGATYPVLSSHMAALGACMLQHPRLWSTEQLPACRRLQGMLPCPGTLPS